MADAPVKPPQSASSHERDDDVIERRTLRDYYIILRERLWIALPLALLVSIGYGYKQMQVTPTYFAAATMQFEKPETVVTTQGVVNMAVTSDVDMNTHIQVLKSAKISQKVLASFTPEEQLILKRPALKRAPPGTSPANVAVSLGQVNAYPTRSSFLVNITVTHEDPEAAALVANRYVDTFWNYLIADASGSNDEAIKFLTDRAEVLQKEAESADAKLQKYVKDHNLISLDSTQPLVAQALNKAGTMRDDARLRVLGLEDKVRQIESYQTGGKNIHEITDIAGRAAVASLRSQLSTLEQRRSLLSERYFERHPEMIKVENEIAVTQADLDKAVALAIAEIRAQLAEARQTLKTYEDEYAKREQESMNLGDKAVEFRSLQSQASAAKQNYGEILKRLSDMRTIKNLDNVPLRPLDRATINTAPIAPNKANITKTCIGLGVLVFLGVAVGLSFIDDRIKSAWDVESFIGANLLGIIPDLSSMKDDDKYNLLIENKQAPGTEAFLSVYSSIKIHSKLDFPKSILVTSTIPGEGKTLISCNVAGSFARHGKKTLLVDCDLRRPMLHRHFKQENSAGLLSWFEGGASLEGDLTSNPALGILKVGDNLWLLCSGGRSKSPTEILENPVFGQLLERLKKEFDLVIVDSPPLGAVTDSLLIAERIDEVVYVCRFNRAYRKHIRLYMRALRNGKNEVLGVVLNGLSPRRIEYYSNYRYYRSYKKYYGAQT
jgi:polysaccharide biosynthesis transport protein